MTMHISIQSFSQLAQKPFDGAKERLFRQPAKISDPYAPICSPNPSMEGKPENFSIST